MLTHETSKKLYKRSLELIPGGVNSPVRACKSVGTDPVFIEKADGAKIHDADGNTLSQKVRKIHMDMSGRLVADANIERRIDDIISVRNDLLF